ncbi:hypothetical protein LTR36_007441 [Oleoguttula mirabilis]|uniref:F-box domain-containing protein n=1 Tax=Oleoguttula mirabilis TaxID=1507867 RepID=A0AAV9JA14_9PEZI|nr:hypothetical protein LTR36_007441 [Oleoguttula mirabilis]
MDVHGGPRCEDEQELFQTPASRPIVVKLPPATARATYATVEVHGGPTYDEQQELFSASTPIVVKHPAATAHSRHGLLWLPAELLDIILAMVTRPSHMVNISQASKKLRDAVYPFLYRNMTLDVSSHRTSTAIEHVCAADSLQHIRTLTISATNPLQHSPSALNVLAFLKRIPVNTIERVRFDVSVSNMSACFELLHDQHPLSSTIRIDKDSDPSSLRDKWFHHQSNVWTSVLCTDTWSNGCLYELMCLINGNPDLLSLELHATSQSGRLNADLLGALMHCKPLCNHPSSTSIDVVEGPCRNKVRNLTLRGGDFGCLAGTVNTTIAQLAQAFDLAGLASLTLRDCEKTTPALQLLANINEPLRLKKLVVLSTTEGREQHSTFFSVLSTLLMRFTGLQTLVISAEAVGLPEVKAVSNHGATLTLLYLDNPVSDGGVYKTHEVRQLVKGCRALEQIALPLQRREVVSPSPPTSEPTLGVLDECDSIEASLAYLATLPRLRTLRILDMPVLPTATRGPYKAAFASFMQGFDTEQAFAQATQSPLSVIAWGRLKYPKHTEQRWWRDIW